MPEERKAQSENQQLPGQDHAGGQRFLLAEMRCKTCLACPLGKPNRYYLEKFFLDDLIVAHWVWSRSRCWTSPNQNLPQYCRGTRQARRRLVTGQREGQGQQDKGLVNGPSRRATE